MFKIVTTKIEWNQTLLEIGSFDFYHTYDYHYISKKQDEDPLLVVYRHEELIIAIPFLKRTVPDTEFFDLTSVYGYAGPISKNIPENYDNNEFRNQFNDYLIASKIISIFSRLNPYICRQNEVIKDLGKLEKIGNLVNIDLKLSVEESRAAYRKDTKSRVNKARRLCTIKTADTIEEINSFIEIYHETMEKLEANDSYFFEAKYFYDFLKCEGFKTEILLAVLNETGEIIAGSMFVRTNNIIQYHLSGTKSEHMRIAPSRILLDEMRIRGTADGFEFFNLGGGYNTMEDALFNFKSSFSKVTTQFKTWKYVVNSSIYNELSSGIDAGSFFPVYRFK